MKVMEKLRPSEPQTLVVFPPDPPLTSWGQRLGFGQEAGKKGRMPGSRDLFGTAYG